MQKNVLKAGLCIFTILTVISLRPLPGLSKTVSLPCDEPKKSTAAKPEPGGPMTETIPTEGTKAPDFKTSASNGQTIALKDLIGKNVVLYFYPKDDTPGCTKEACGFRDLNKELQKAGVVVLGVSADSGESHTKFAQKYRLPFTLLSDPERKLMTAWGAYGDKMMYGKKTTGVIRSTVWIVPDGLVRKHWKEVAGAAK